MFNSKDICDRIRSFYPDSGECGKDLRITYDQDEHAWVVEALGWKRPMKTFVDEADVDACLTRGHCVALSFQVGQLRANAGGGSIDES